MRHLALALCVVPALALAERPDDFASGIPLQVDGRESLYQIEVPRAVYEAVVRADLGDIRVFNAAGEVVPHAFRPRRAATAEKPRPVPVALFPIRTDAPAGVEGVDLHVEQAGDRTVVSLRTRDGQPAAGEKLVGYVADATAHDKPVRAVVLELPAGGDVVARLTVEASDDLRAWTTLARGVSVMRLEAGGRRLEQLRIEVPPRKAKYLRLSWDTRDRAVELAGVSVEAGDVTVDAPRQWKEVAGAVVKDRPGEYEFDLGGRFQIDRIRLDLPQANTVAAVEILARARPVDPWRHVAAGTVYRLSREGAEISSPDIAVGPLSDRYWLFRVDQRGGGIGGGHPALRAGWLPHRLVFVARGAPPFELAYGSRDALPAAYPIATLVPSYRDDDALDVATVQPGAKQERLAFGAVQAGAPRPLGGDAAVRERIDWKRWVLWGSLVLGVVLLAAMAIRLGRQITKPNAPTTEPSQRERPTDD